MSRPVYRLYIDEVGHSGLTNVTARSKYLSLTGVIIRVEHSDEVLGPELEQLKRSFFPAHHVDEPVILHRKEIINKKGPFSPLAEPKADKEFSAELLRIMSEVDYRVLVVSIDKLEHLNRYQTWVKDPYHYSIEVMLERYYLFLRNMNSLGDVMAESRGGKEDIRLKEEFNGLYESGTRFIAAEDIQSRITSRKIKIKPKSSNVPGLQFADLLAHPCFTFSKCLRDGSDYPAVFGKQVIGILKKGKFVCDTQGRLLGYGIKWLP